MILISNVKKSMIYFVHLQVIKIRSKQFCIQHMLLRYIFEFLLITNIFQLIDEQHSIFDKITQVVNSGKGGVFFLHCYGGTIKAFMWRTLSSALHSQKNCFYYCFKSYRFLIISRWKNITLKVQNPCTNT